VDVVNVPTETLDEKIDLDKLPPGAMKLVEIDATLSVGVYTPCTATMSNNNSFYGQVVGGTIAISNNWSMTYRPIVIPGAHITGFTEDIAYIREVS
jgi:hypothetical protein